MCPRCQKNPVEPVHLELVDKWIIPICHECGDKYDAEQARKEHAAQQGKIARLLRMSDFGERFERARFQDFIVRPGTKAMYDEAEQFVREFPKIRGLAMIGPAGTGKTLLAAAICNTLTARDVGGVMRSTPMLFGQLRQCIAQSKSEWDILEAAMKADLLVLDDLGAEKPTEKLQEWLYTIINGRYIARGPVVLTSNLPFGQLAERIGERTVDRLAEMCRIVSCEKATSVRLEKARENAKPWRHNGDLD